eukprot:scaffold150080_cov24-Attheya_sp.AAC.1
MATVEPIAFGDLTGQYPHMSSRGNKYILIIYDYDTNAIIAEPLKGRTKGDILNGYRNVHKLLARNGYKPTMQTLDNEASDILLEYMSTSKPSERPAIRYFPNISGVVSFNKQLCPSIYSAKHACIPNYPRIMHYGERSTTIEHP